ncbi:hypothetical protein BpHYR1_023041 [Brachionus plicatilis]|uniref:Uncharacterized protein n=1 Tax=Brachionus plicatilis TaxID=10195 RepID=A0A3M7QMQ8_BRAPC|nr:hypothetical protein BpHYR1_023041 [Brachionus plicatilis]
MLYGLLESIKKQFDSFIVKSMVFELSKHGIQLQLGLGLKYMLNEGEVQSDPVLQFFPWFYALFRVLKK